jgi:hypothetical protein
VVLGYTETFVSTRLNGVASREAASVTLSEAGPMYENVTGFYMTCRESYARLLLLPSASCLLRATAASNQVPIGKNRNPVWTLWRRKSRSCEESNSGDSIAWSVY